MNRNWPFLLMVFFLGLGRASADDTYPSATSSDGKIKITVLYVGPIHDKQIPQPFVVVYLREDGRSDSEIKDHPEVHLIPLTPDVFPSTTSSALPKTDWGSERSRVYTTALMAPFRALYPKITIPVPDVPDHAEVFEFFYKVVPDGPLRIVFHDTYVFASPNHIGFDDIPISDPPAP